jgi:hypothetical protein
MGQAEVVGAVAEVSLLVHAGSEARIEHPWNLTPPTQGLTLQPRLLARRLDHRPADAQRAGRGPWPRNNTGLDYP